MAQYRIGTDGIWTLAGVPTLTGGNVEPVTLLTDGSASSAYLLVNLANGPAVSGGTVYQYAIDGSGAPAPDTPASLGVASGPSVTAILSTETCSTP